MLLMTWIRNEHGGFTAYPTDIHRARLIHRRREQLAAAMRRVMQQLYCHEQTALFLYEALAVRAKDAARRATFLSLAEMKKQQLAHRQEMLLRLKAPIPGECRPLWARLWQALLLCLGDSIVLAYIKFIKRRDLRRQVKLFEIIGRMNKP